MFARYTSLTQREIRWSSSVTMRAYNRLSVVHNKCRRLTKRAANGGCAARFHLCLRQGAGKQFAWLGADSVKVTLSHPAHQPSPGCFATGTPEGGFPLKLTFPLASLGDASPRTRAFGNPPANGWITKNNNHHDDNTYKVLNHLRCPKNWDNQVYSSFGLRHP